MGQRGKLAVVFVVAVGLVGSACGKKAGIVACFDTSKGTDERYVSCVQQCDNESNKAACTLVEDLRRAKQATAAGGSVASSATASAPAVVASTSASSSPSPSAMPGKNGTDAIKRKRLADAAKKSVTSADAVKLRQLTHPTGDGGRLGALKVTESDDAVLVDIPVDWTGGITGAQYETVYRWQLDGAGGSELTVMTDSAQFEVDARHLALADSYFKTKRAAISP